MKLNRFALLAVLLGSALTMLPTSKAADNDTKPADKPQVKGRAARADRLKQVSEELKLSDEQKEKLKPILQEQAKKVRELRDNKDLSRQDRVAKLKETREGIDTKVKAILTPEQLEKWNKLRSEGPRRRRQE